MPNRPPTSPAKAMRRYAACWAEVGRREAQNRTHQTSSPMNAAVLMQEAAMIAGLYSAGVITSYISVRISAAMTMNV